MRRTLIKDGKMNEAPIEYSLTTSDDNVYLEATVDGFSQILLQLKPYGIAKVAFVSDELGLPVDKKGVIIEELP